MQLRTGPENGKMATRRPGGIPPVGAPALRGGFPVDYGPRVDDRRQGLSSPLSRPGHHGRDDHEDTPPSRHLWIGNVSHDATEAAIREKFSQIGDVDSVTVYSSRNYAFVNFRNLHDAVEAKNRLQGFVIGGMAIRIEYAKGRNMLSELARYRDKDSDHVKCMEEQVAARATQSRHLWVGGISPNVTKEQIEGEFRNYGVLEDFKLLRERNCAFVDYIRIEDAVNAVEALNRKRIGDEELRVDYGRSQPSKRDSRGDQKSSQDGYNSQHGLQGGSGNGVEGRVKADKDGGPSEILWVGFPLPSKVDEDGLRRAFMPYGEVERVKTFPGRTYAFVQFQKVEEATRAKNALDGKLFDDPRVHIRYSKSEIGPIDSPRDGPPSRTADRQGFSTDVLGGPRGMPPAAIDRFGSPGRTSANPSTRLGGLRPEYRPNALMAGLVDRGSSRESDVEPGMGRTSHRNVSHIDDLEYSRGIRPDSRSSYDDAWDLPDADIVPRESKRLRVYPGGGADSPGLESWYDQRPQPSSDSGSYVGTGVSNNYENLRVPAAPDYSFGLGSRPRVGLPGAESNNSLPIGSRPAVVGHAPPPNSSVIPISSTYAKHSVEDVKEPEGWQWHGTIAKGGTPVCRARCLPVGKGIDATVPDVVNCTARTDLDMLAKHVYQAGGFGVVFFVPEGDPDVPPYQDFMHYLGEKHRAGVAKLSDGTTLFLVPPSEFSEKVLKVPGDNCLFGVVLKSQPVSAPVISYNLSAQQQQQISSLAHPPYPQQQIPSQHAPASQSLYSQNQVLPQHVLPIQEPAPYQGFHHSLPHDEQPAQTGLSTSISLNDSLASGVPISNSNSRPMLTQAQLGSIAGLPGVLTPELIASLTALLPKTNNGQASSSTDSNVVPPLASKVLKIPTGISVLPVGSTQPLGGSLLQSDVRPMIRPSQSNPPITSVQGWLQQHTQQDRSQAGVQNYHSQAADQSTTYTSQAPSQQHSLYVNPSTQFHLQQSQQQSAHQSTQLQAQSSHISGPLSSGQISSFAGPPAQHGYPGPSVSSVLQFPPLPLIPRPPQQPMGAPQQQMGPPPQLPSDQLAQLTALLTQRQQQTSQQQTASHLLQQHLQHQSTSSSGQATAASQPQQVLGSLPQQHQPQHQPPPGLPHGPPLQSQPPKYGQYSQSSLGQVSVSQSSGRANSQLSNLVSQSQHQNSLNVPTGSWESSVPQASAGSEQQVSSQNHDGGDADAQTKRFQATVQLAAALLQQMQQQQGKPSGNQEQH
ncbi:flowering time control protein FPA isoform X2 [Physcomitrium patens]|uniref:RRM domain-containing protein n=1 Tax=Physcomitrium patens TaxID=3218 RepID=A9RVJ9_PHYPA|nr:flowering time control protein FPA-like isoform X2 [Physcomitrium patens]|eukprot:XP_024388640.1 flowering time control protein FPA-like isoform X2 [Physcomitrella patens]